MVSIEVHSPVSEFVQLSTTYLKTRFHCPSSSLTKCPHTSLSPELFSLRICPLACHIPPPNNTHRRTQLAQHHVPSSNPASSTSRSITRQSHLNPQPSRLARPRDVGLVHTTMHTSSPFRASQTCDAYTDKHLLTYLYVVDDWSGEYDASVLGT